MQQRFLFRILLLAQHVSGTTMPIIRSSRVLYSGCCSILQTRHITLSSTPDRQHENHSTKYHRRQPLYNINPLLHLVGILFPHINDDARSNSHQNYRHTFEKRPNIKFHKNSPSGNRGVFHANRWTGRQANSRSSQFCARTYKWQPRIPTKCFYERFN